MLRYTTILVTAMILLSGSVWAQVCPTRIPPGHYYCNVHNEICTHGLSTPEVYYRPARTVVVQNPNYGYGVPGQAVRADRHHRKAHRKARKRARNNARICR